MHQWIGHGPDLTDDARRMAESTLLASAHLTRIVAMVRARGGTYLRGW